MPPRGKCLKWAGTEGLRITPKVSFQSNFSITPIFEDTTIYALDAKLGVTSTSSDPSLLPPPRSSLETQWTGAYRLHLNNLPDATGFFQVRNSRGEISVPAVLNGSSTATPRTTRSTSD